MPHEPLDAPEDLPKEAPRQVVLDALEPEGPGVPDQAAAGLEEPLLEITLDIRGPVIRAEGRGRLLKPAEEANA